jgi:drug/metabolite transporter (DMT)-like permease
LRDPSRPLNAPDQSLEGRSILLLLLLTLLWGITFPAMKVALRGFPPILLSGFRFLLAGSLFMPLCRLRGIPIVRGTQGARLYLLFYALAGALGIILLPIGVKHTLANRGSILFNTSPFWVLVLGIFLLPGDRLTLNKWMGTGLAFVGVLLLFTGGGDLDPGASRFGDGLVLGAAIVWGFRIVFLKHFPSQTRAETIQVWQFLIAGPILTILGLAFENITDIQLDGPVILSFLYLAVVSNAVGYFLWTYLVQKEVATKVAPFMFLSPVFGVMASSAILGERITGQILVSLGLVGVGILLVNWQRTRGKPHLNAIYRITH